VLVRRLQQQLDDLSAMVGRPVCCVCENPPTFNAPLYRLNGLPAGPLWACWGHYVAVKLRKPATSTPTLEAK
jgi:hypothetical protein